MALTLTYAFKGSGEVAVMVVEVTKRFGRRPFQWAEFVEQAWFVLSVTLMPTILVSVPFGAVISLQVGNLTGQLGAESFAGATAVLATVREAALGLRLGGQRLVARILLLSEAEVDQRAVPCVAKRHAPRHFARKRETPCHSAWYWPFGFATRR